MLSSPFALRVKGDPYWRSLGTTLRFAHSSSMVRPQLFQFYYFAGEAYISSSVRYSCNYRFKVHWRVRQIAWYICGCHGEKWFLTFLVPSGCDYCYGTERTQILHHSVKSLAQRKTALTGHLWGTQRVGTSWGWWKSCLWMSGAGLSKCAVKAGDSCSSKRSRELVSPRSIFSSNGVLTSSLTEEIIKMSTPPPKRAKKHFLGPFLYSSW